MCCCTAGSSTPASALKTMSAVAPAWDGKRDCSRSVAACESVPCRRKLWVQFVPALLDTTLSRTSATTHPSSTRRRWR